MRLGILHLDDDVVAIDKPVGLSTHAAWHDVIPGDVVGILKAQLGVEYLGTHQRLDRDTSGVMVFARRPAANAWLSQAFEARSAGKEYLAVVHGAPAASGRIDAPIVPAGGGRQRVASAGEGRDQPPAVTEYTVVARSPDRRLSLLRLHPLTGRTHQLRVHLAHIGAPMVGDPLYDPRSRPFPRLLLHAGRLSLPTPGGVLLVKASPPPIFESLMADSSPVDLAQGIASGTDQRGEPLPAILSLAAGRRRPIADDGDSVYRLLNGAGDGVAGLIADRYGAVIVAHSQADAPGGADLLMDRLRDVWQPQAIVWRMDQASGAGERVWGALPGDTWAVSEGGLRYVVGLDGLTTDLPTELREMRARVRVLAAGRVVLNLFAGACAFGLAATAGGAARVLNLDRSRQRLERGMAGYAANGFGADRYDFVDGDMFDWLNRFRRRGQRFDMVIVTPSPDTMPRRSRHDVERDWPTLAQQAAAVVAPGGLLLACSRQPRLARRQFKGLVLSGAQEAGRPASEVAYWRASALDFPAAPGDEGAFKGLLLRLDTLSP